MGDFEFLIGTATSSESLGECGAEGQERVEKQAACVCMFLMAFQVQSTVGTEQYSTSDVWIYPTSVKPGQFQKMLKLSVKLIQWLRHADVRDILRARTLQSDLIPFRKVGIGPEMKTYCD